MKQIRIFGFFSPHCLLLTGVWGRVAQAQVLGILAVAGHVGGPCLFGAEGSWQPRHHRSTWNEQRATRCHNHFGDSPLGAEIECTLILALNPSSQNSPLCLLFSTEPKVMREMSVWGDVKAKTSLSICTLRSLGTSPQSPPPLLLPINSRLLRILTQNVYTLKISHHNGFLYDQITCWDNLNHNSW